MTEPRVALLYGGTSREREVSLGSGKAAAEALERFYEVDRFDVQTYSRLPDGLDAERHVVFSTLHGLYGEDGTMQAMLEKAGVVFAGCDSASSALTFDKVETKRVLSRAGVSVAKQFVFGPDDTPSVSEILAQLGESLVVKPVAEGSSVGLLFVEGEEELAGALDQRGGGNWMVEPRIVGKEVTVGMLGGEAMGVVEIRPKSGRFDYSSKYTKGLTEYIVPARIDENLTKRLQEMAAASFEACGCRDYARIDFMVDTEGKPFVLEINTLPGLKETSLLPMSASVFGYNFDELLQKLVEPAFLRYRSRYSVS